jgi:hypothetical protein
MRSFGLILLTGCALLAGATVARAADLSNLSLAGEWYMLIHYKDATSEDKSITKFKDFEWSIRQEPTKLEIDEYPYVIFDEGSETIRRASMRGHKPWEPEGMVLDALLQHVDVSSRAMRSKQLEGSTKAGMKSPEPAASTGGATMSFVRNWDVTWSPAAVKISIVDSLSGGSAALGGMEEAAVFEIVEQTSPDELRGTWSEGDKSGSLRMIRSKERRVLK